MTHSAKKITTGEYEYRGYHVEEVGQYGDTPNISQWNITHTASGETAAHDAANTLKDAKAMIDYWLGE